MPTQEKKTRIISPFILKKLQENQKELDLFIHRQNKIKQIDTFLLRKVALFVEIGEVANELQSFKYWKKLKKVNEEKIKEELIDCLHFFLSLANDCQIDFTNYNSPPFSLNKYQDLNKILLTLFARTKKLNLSKKNPKELKKSLISKNYHYWLKTFEKLCGKMAINEKSLLETYYNKSQINRQRQLTNY